jgi:thiosulfate/3-mercaptopyruvate sulfurtransferase
VDRDPVAEFEAAHIPGAARFDINRIADQANPLPHMVPPADEFVAAMRALGVNSDSHVVFYDDSAIKPATRGWWMMRLFGHDTVSVLDGGLAAWRGSGGPLESGGESPRAPGNFVARPSNGAGVSDYTSIVSAIGDGGLGQLLDARAAARFAGRAAEPRAGLRSGHIPGSKNLPFDQLLDDDGRFLAEADLRQRFAAAGIDTGQPVLTSCGSGVTACVLALGLCLVGNDDVSVYDGSWTEWGGSKAPIETGDA